MADVKYIGKNSYLYSTESPIDRINARMLTVGVLDMSSKQKSIRVSSPLIVDRPKDVVRLRLQSIQYRSRKRNYDCDLTYEHIKRLLDSECAYCGNQESLQLDRKDNNKGYTLENVVAACKRCNTVKSMYLSYNEMVLVAKTLGWRK